MAIARFGRRACLCPTRVANIYDAAVERSCHTRQQRCAGSRSGQSTCAANCESKKDDVARHVRCENVAERDESHSVNQTPATA